jgi:hypothetical protein
MDLEMLNGSEEWTKLSSAETIRYRASMTPCLIGPVVPRDNRRSRSSAGWRWRKKTA